MQWITKALTIVFIAGLLNASATPADGKNETFLTTDETTTVSEIDSEKNSTLADERVSTQSMQSTNSSYSDEVYQMNHDTSTRESTSESDTPKLTSGIKIASSNDNLASTDGDTSPSSSPEVLEISLKNNTSSPIKEYFESDDDPGVPLNNTFNASNSELNKESEKDVSNNSVTSTEASNESSSSNSVEEDDEHLNHTSSATSMPLTSSDIFPTKEKVSDDSANLSDEHSNSSLQSSSATKDFSSNDSPKPTGASESEDPTYAHSAVKRSAEQLAPDKIYSVSEIEMKEAMEKSTVHYGESLFKTDELTSSLPSSALSSESISPTPYHQKSNLTVADSLSTENINENEIKTSHFNNVTETSSESSDNSTNVTIAMIADEITTITSPKTTANSQFHDQTTSSVSESLETTAKPSNIVNENITTEPVSVDERHPIKLTTIQTKSEINLDEGFNTTSMSDTSGEEHITNISGHESATKTSSGEINGTETSATTSYSTSTPPVSRSRGERSPEFNEDSHQKQGIAIAHPDSLPVNASVDVTSTSLHSSHPTAPSELNMQSSTMVASIIESSKNFEIGNGVSEITSPVKHLNSNVHTDNSSNDISEHQNYELAFSTDSQTSVEATRKIPVEHTEGGGGGPSKQDATRTQFSTPTVTFEAAGVKSELSTDSALSTPVRSAAPNNIPKEDMNMSGIRPNSEDISGEIITAQPLIEMTMHGLLPASSIEDILLNDSPPASLMATENVVHNSSVTVLFETNEENNKKLGNSHSNEAMQDYPSHSLGPQTMVSETTHNKLVTGSTVMDSSVIHPTQMNFQEQNQPTLRSQIRNDNAEAKTADTVQEKNFDMKSLTGDYTKAMPTIVSEREPAEIMKPPKVEEKLFSSGSTEPSMGREKELEPAKEDANNATTSGVSSPMTEDVQLQGVTQNESISGSKVRPISSEGLPIEPNDTTKSTEYGNESNFTTQSTEPTLATTTKRSFAISKPKLKTNPDGESIGSMFARRRPTSTTKRPTTSKSGPPVSIFGRSRTRRPSITSSTTQRTFTRPSVQRVSFGPVRIIGTETFSFSLPETTTPPTTTEAEIEEEEEEEEEVVELQEEPRDDEDDQTISEDDDVIIMTFSASTVVERGIRWKKQLHNRPSPEYKKQEERMHRTLEKLFRGSSVGPNVWKIEIDGFIEKYPGSRSVEVDYFVYLVKTDDALENAELVRAFNERLTNNTFSRYTFNPAYTQFQILREERLKKPTEAPDVEPPIPQWAIAVIVIGTASFIFIVLFAAVTIYGRHHMRRRYTSKLDDDLERSEDSREWEKKLGAAAAYENLAADVVYDAEDNCSENAKRSYFLD